MRLPTGFTSVATTGVRSSARPAQGMGDMCRQVSWLAAQTLSPTFPTWLNGAGQWHMWRELAAYSCGGSPGFACFNAYRVPIFTGADCAAPEPSQLDCAPADTGPSSAAARRYWGFLQDGAQKHQSMAPNCDRSSKIACPRQAISAKATASRAPTAKKIHGRRAAGNRGWACGFGIGCKAHDRAG